MAFLLTSFGCATPANWRPTPAYVGAGIVYGLDHFDLSDAERDSGLELQADGALGGDLRVGVRLHPLAEIELQVQGYEDFEVQASDGSEDEVALRTLTCNLRLHELRSWLPELDERWRPYLLLGIGVLHAETNGSGLLRALEDDAIAARVGLGLQVFLSSGVAWTAEGSLLEPFGDLEGLSVVTLGTGLEWRF